MISRVSRLTRCTARKPFTVTVVCLCENRSKPRAKARAEPRERTGAANQRVSALHEPTGYCTRPSATPIEAMAELQASLQRTEGVHTLPVRIIDCRVVISLDTRRRPGSSAKQQQLHRQP